MKHLREAGLDACGIDVSPEMIPVAERRLGPGVVRVQRLQDLEGREEYDAVVSLSFPFNYCARVSEAREAFTGISSCSAVGRAPPPAGGARRKCPRPTHRNWEPGPIRGQGKRLALGEAGAARTQAGRGHALRGM